MSNYSDYIQWHAEKKRIIRENWGKCSPIEIRAMIDARKREWPVNSQYPFHVPTIVEILQAALVFDIASDDEYLRWYTFYARKPMTPSRKKQIINRDGGRCVRCHSTEKLEVDHILPVALGGGNEDGNLQTLCFRCNRAKGACDPGE